jgi:hypothetical protein
MKLLPLLLIVAVLAGCAKPLTPRQQTLLAQLKAGNPALSEADARRGALLMDGMIDAAMTSATNALRKVGTP